jgi:hypothetical protein
MRIGEDMNSLYPNYVIEKRTLVYTNGGRSRRRGRKGRRRTQRV